MGSVIYVEIYDDNSITTVFDSCFIRNLPYLLAVVVLFIESRCIPLLKSSPPASTFPNPGSLQQQTSTRHILRHNARYRVDDMGKLSRQSSRQPLSINDDASSLTSFPDPASAAANDVSPAADAPLNSLLDRAGPSIFDERAAENIDLPQTLARAPKHVLETIVSHNGPVPLVRRLATLLAERDAHITALTRLAEEYKVPRERIEETTSRIKQAEQRRLALDEAMEDEIETPQPSERLAPKSLPVEDAAPSGSKLTRMFGGGTIKGSSTVRRKSPASSRSTSVAPPTVRKQRPDSIDARSVQSNEGGWAAQLFGNPLLRRTNSGESELSREPVEMFAQHDREDLPPTLQETREDPQEAAWNRFLLNISKSRQKNGIQSTGLVGSLVGQPKMKALTHLVVAGIPMHMRQHLWPELSNTESIMEPGAYDAYRANSELVDQSEIDTIVSDVPRTLTQSRNFYTNRGFARLKELLVAFVAKYDNLGYTQGLNSIAGYLLLAIPNNEDAFWVLCNMVENFFPLDYFSRETALTGPLADVIVLRSYVKELMPQLSKHMEDLDIGAQHTVPVRWFFTAFSNVLGEDALMRVWDIWLCLPGQKSFLFNVALALLKENLGGLLACESEGEYWAYLDDKQQCKVDGDAEWVNKLIKSAVEMRKELGKVEERRALETKLLRRKAGSCEALYSPDDVSPAEPNGDVR